MLVVIELRVDIILANKKFLERGPTGRITTARIATGQNYLSQFQLVKIIFTTAQIRLNGYPTI
jgi:hypothetical protein